MSVRNNTIDLLWVFRRSEEEDCVEGTKILCVSDGEEVVTFVVLSKKIRRFFYQTEWNIFPSVC